MNNLAFSYISGENGDMLVKIKSMHLQEFYLLSVARMSSSHNLDGKWWYFD